MPNFNGTGPFGQGAGSGRGFGPCANGGYGFCGRGFRRYVSPKNELIALENEEKALEEELAMIREEKSALTKKEK